MFSDNRSEPIIAEPMRDIVNALFVREGTAPGDKQAEFRCVSSEEASELPDLAFQEYRPLLMTCFGAMLVPPLSSQVRS